MKLIALSLAWITGIYIGSLISLPLYAFLLSLIFFLTIILLWRKNLAFIWGGLCLIVLLGGIICYQWRTSESYLPFYLTSYEEQGVVEIKGVVARDLEYEDGFSRLSLSAKEIKADSQWEGVSGKVLIYTQGFPYYSQGDSLEVKGEIQPISLVEDPGYRAYLIKQGYCATIYYPQIEFIQRGWLFDLRNRLAQSLESALPEPQCSLSQALLLGLRSHIPDSLNERFNFSGTAHLLAISGLNVAIIAGIVLSSTAWLFGRRRPTYILITFSLIWIYALLTGIDPPVLRAAIMFSLFLTALWLGRPQSTMPSLAFAAAIMVGINPQILWEISFQLSFVAVAGIILLFPHFKRWGRKAVGVKKGLLPSAIKPIVDSLAVSMAALIATFPLIAYYFSYISLISLPATFFAILAIPGATIVTLITALLGLFAPILSWTAGWVDWLFLSYIIKVAEIFGSLGFAKHELAINGVMVWTYYGVIIAILWRKRLAMPLSRITASAKAVSGKLAKFTYRLPKRWVLVFLLIIAVLIWLAVITVPGRQLEVIFFDIGQGDAILIQTPSRQQILIDGGPDPENICLSLGDKLPFWDKSLDLVVLTHPDDDHITGLVEVLRRYKVEKVLEPGLYQDTPAYQEWLRLIDEKDIERTIAKAGQQIELGGGIKMEVLHPQEELMVGTESDTNNNSVVLRLAWNEVSFLLTGDISEETEREILFRGYNVRSTVLKVAHHGSAISTSSHFLSAVNSQLAIISVGNDNPFGHPDEGTLARLREKIGEDNIYLTSQKGTIKITTDGERLWLKVER